MIRISLVVFFSGIFSLFLNSQSKKIDSLLTEIKKATNDSNKVSSFLELSRQFKYSNPDTAIKITMSALHLAEKLKWVPGIWRAYSDLGASYNSKSEYDSAIFFLSKSIALCETKNDEKGLSVGLTNIGISYMRKSNFPKSIDCFLRSLKITEKLNIKRGSSTNYGNLGTLYKNIKEYDKALEYYLLAYTLSKEMGDEAITARHLGNIGNIYAIRERYDSALICFENALKICKEQNDKNSEAAWLGAIGHVYTEQADHFSEADRKKRNSFYEKAISNYLMAYDLSVQVNDQEKQAGWLGKIGSAYLNLGKYVSAEKSLKEALARAEAIGAYDEQMNLHASLSRLYTKSAKHELALYHYKKEVGLRDTLVNEENTKKIVKAEMNFEFEKKEAVARFEADKKAAVNEADRKKQRVVLLSVISCLLLVSAFALFAYRSFLQKKKANISISRQKEVIEEKQKEILDSIYYARRIQNALLTSERYIEKRLNQLCGKK